MTILSYLTLTVATIWFLLGLLFFLSAYRKQFLAFRHTKISKLAPAWSLFGGKPYVPEVQILAESHVNERRVLRPIFKKIGKSRFFPLWNPAKLQRKALLDYSLELQISEGPRRRRAESYLRALLPKEHEISRLVLAVKLDNGKLRKLTAFES